MIYSKQQETLPRMTTTKNDIEINKVRDENRILKTENEVLKEKNDTDTSWVK